MLSTIERDRKRKLRRNYLILVRTIIIVTIIAIVALSIGYSLYPDTSVETPVSPVKRTLQDYVTDEPSGYEAPEPELIISTDIINPPSLELEEPEPTPTTRKDKSTKQQGQAPRSNKETSQTSGTKLTKRGGVNYFNGNKETWYSQRVLPGGGLKIPGRHVCDQGLVRDKDNNIVVASSDLSKGTIVQTSLGQGKVYDTGCPSGVIDIYTDW